MRIDLHSHSTASDGTDPPAEVMRRARAAGVDVIALTDHDTLAGHDEARQALPGGLSLVTGMELSARLDGHSVHLLSYLPGGASPELAAECQAIRDDRIRRGQAMVERLRDLGVDITWPQVAALAAGGSVGRPHIARAIVAAGAIAAPRRRVRAGLIGRAAGLRSAGTRWTRPGRSGWSGPAAGRWCWPTRERSPGAGGFPRRPSPPWPGPGSPAWRWIIRITTRGNGPGSGGRRGPGAGDDRGQR